MLGSLWAMKFQFLTLYWNNLENKLRMFQWEWGNWKQEVKVELKMKSSIREKEKERYQIQDPLDTTNCKTRTLYSLFANLARDHNVDFVKWLNIST